VRACGCLHSDLMSHDKHHCELEKIGIGALNSA